jgi:glutathione-regulated potassium-efflux system ancillary protein KefG
MSERKNKIMVLYFHPNHHKSRINNALISAIDGIDGITIRNMYEIYPDFYINIQREQQLLLEHDLIVWQHPFYWYSSPALLKEWIDLVLEHGFAYGRTGTALKGKQVMSAITSGGRREVYRKGGSRNYTIPQLLAPFRQTVQICYMDYLAPFVVHGTHLLDRDSLMPIAAEYKKLLISLRDSLFGKEEMNEVEYLNDLLT